MRTKVEINLDFHRLVNEDVVHIYSQIHEALKKITNSAGKWMGKY